MLSLEPNQHFLRSHKRSFEKNKYQRNLNGNQNTHLEVWLVILSITFFRYHSYSRVPGGRHALTWFRYLENTSQLSRMMLGYWTNLSCFVYSSWPLLSIFTLILCQVLEESYLFIINCSIVRSTFRSFWCHWLHSI